MDGLSTSIEEELTEEKLIQILGQIPEEVPSIPITHGVEEAL